jgi:hypothetical protein
MLSRRSIAFREASAKANHPLLHLTAYILLFLERFKILQAKNENASNTDHSTAPRAGAQNNRRNISRQNT